jgi:GAF domain-containing protein/nitrogen-specific signal transduction histidine kinase
MDTTIASTSTSAWELLAQLARHAQDGAAATPAAQCAALAALLERHLPAAGGCLELLEDGDVVASAAWGVGAAPAIDGAATAPLAIIAEGDLLGRLTLGAAATALDPTFAQALVAQLALVLLQRQRAHAAELAAQLRALVAAHLELVGTLETRTLLQAMLTKASGLLGVVAAAAYTVEEAEGQLQLLAAGDGEFAFPPTLPAQGQNPAAQAIAARAAQVGRLSGGAGRRRGAANQSVERAALALPLQAQERLAGVLLLVLPGDQPAPRLQRLAALFAEQTALLVRNAQLFSYQEQRARELFVLYENSQEINSATQIESMLNRATENIALALGAEYCAVKLLDDQLPDSLRVVASYSELGGAGRQNGSHGPSATSKGTLVAGAAALLAQVGRSSPLLIRDTAAVAAHNPVASSLAADGWQSAMLLPLRGKDETIGLLAVGFARARRPVSPAERNLAQVLAAQVSTAILNRRLYLAERQRAEELELLQRVSQRLNADLDLEGTLEAILDGVRALRFSGARVLLLGPREEAPQLAAQLGLGASAGLATGLTGWIARHHSPLQIDDLRTPPPELGELGELGALSVAGSPARAFLGAPLRLGEDLIGTLELFSARPGAFSAGDLRLLTILAGQVAQAITNANRYEQADANLRSRVEQLRALQRVSSQLAITLDQDEILAYVLEQAIKATGAARGLIALRAESATPDGRIALSALGGQQAPEIYRSSLDDAAATDDVAYLVAQAVGFPESARSALLQAPLDSGAVTAFHALASREPELADELGPGEQAALRSGSARSALAAPIFYQAGVYGVLLLLASEPRAFDHDAVEFLRALTHQAAVGIGNAQRYSELEQLSKQYQRRSDMLSDVLEIGQLLRVDRNLTNLLEQVGYSAMESANVRTVLFCLAEPDAPQLLRPVSAAGIPLNELDRIAQEPLPAELATRYLDPRFRLGRSYFVPAEEARELEAGFATSVFSYSPFDDDRGPDEWQTGDRLCVPLYATEGNLLGLMFVGDPQDRQRPVARSVEPLAIFADQAAIAIENHNLLRDAETRAEQMSALFQVGTAFTSTTDLDTLLTRVYQEIVAYLGTPTFFYIASYLPEAEQVRFELFMRQGEINLNAHKTTAPKAGLTAEVIESGRPLLVEDLLADPVRRSLAVNHGAGAEHIRSWLGVPLISQNRVIGVLSVQDFAPNVFNERDRQFLAGLANQLAIAMERATLFRERERRISELNIINRVGQITSSTLDLELMLRQTYEQLGTFLSLDSFFIFVYHEPENTITLSFEVDGSFQELDRAQRAPADGSLTAQIIRTKRHLRFHDLGREYQPAGYTPIMFGSARQSASWLGVPLLVGDGSVVGVMAVMSYTPGLYGERELAFMTTVANQLALGVQNARLLATAREQVEQLALLNRVSVLAGAETEAQRIYQLIVDAMADATGVDQARLVIYDRARGVAPAVAEHVPSGVLHAIEVPLADSPSVDWLDANLRPLIAEDAQSDSLFVRSHETFRELDIRSIALVPIVVDGEVIGAVGLDFVGRRGTFSQEDVRLCQTIASQTSTALARARAASAAQRSADALRQKVNEQQTLLDAARILSSLLRPQEVLDKLMELVSRQLNVTTVALWTIGADDVLVPAALSGIPAERGRTMRVPVGQGLTGRVAALGRAMIIDDVNADGSSLYPAYQRDNNLVSFMGVPVVYREQLIGVLSVMTNYQRRFSEDERALLEGLADQAATALENARLFEEREQRIAELSTINAISAAVNATLDLQALLETLHAGIGEVIDVSTSMISLYDETSDTLAYPVIYDRGVRMQLAPQPLRRGSNAWAVRNRQPLLLRSLDEARALGLVVDDVRIGDSPEVEESYLVTPILFGSRVLGVINIQSYEPRAFDENDLRFLTTVANQAAVALNNARLFSETRQNAAEMTTLFEVTKDLSGTLDPLEVQQLVADAALRLLGAELCAVLRLDRMGRIEHQVLVERDRRRSDLRIGFRLDGMTARLVEQQEPIAIVDLREMPGANSDALELGIRSVLGIAVGTQDDRLGVIWVGAYQPHEWSRHQISLISILANQAGQALKSAQLFELEQQRRRLADTLRDVAQSFTSTLALREIQTLILDQLSRVVAYDSAAVLLRDEGYGNLQITEARGLSDKALLEADFKVEESELLAALATERRPVLIEDVLLEPRFTPLLRLGWQARTWVGAPLLVDNELVGILAIGAALPSAYDADDVENTFALANQASQAIQNARLFDQISNLAADLERRVAERTTEYEQASRQVTEQKERLEAVHNITLELTTQLDLNAIIRQALELISNHLGVARGSIMLTDPSTMQLVCRAVLYSQGDVRAANIPLSFQEGPGLAGWVMEHQESVNIADVLIDPRWVLEQGRADDVRSAAAVPLKTGEAILGVLVLSSPQVGFFKDSQMNLLGTIAGVVAAALANAQLYSYITDLAGRNAVLLEQQREETSKNDAVLRSVTEGVIVLDTDGTIRLFNPAAETVLEIPAGAVTDQPLSVLEQFGADEMARRRAHAVYNGLMAGLRQVREGQRMYSTSIDLVEPSQVIAVNLAPVLRSDGGRYGDVAVLRDITREIEADHAKRQFISDVSHELRTPLTAVKGYVDVLLLSGTSNLNDDQVSYLGIIKNNTNRLRSLIEDILDFARPDSKKKLTFSPVSIPIVVGEVVQMLRLEYERKEMEVLVDVPSDLPIVMADQKRLTQVFQNLFSNAVKYTYEGGRIQVRAYLNRANMLQVEVEDNGVGMSKEQQKRLFRPFYRADNPLRDVAGGTGLGLAIAKQFVEMHGGEMWVQSDQGRGSVFSFIVPLQQSDAADFDEDAE